MVAVRHPVFPPRTTILPGKLVSPPHRTMLALQLVGGFAAGFNLPASLTTRNVQSSVSMAVPRASRREALSIGAAAAAFVVASPPRAAFASLDPNDMSRFKKALDGVNYLLDNWEQETTECTKQAGGGGECTDQPDKVRYYMGLRTTDHPLFQLDKLYAKAQTKLPDDADFEEWIEATEGLASQIAKINELAYTCAAPGRALLPIPLTTRALETDARKNSCSKQVLVRRVQPRRWQGAGPQVPPPLPRAGNKVQGFARDHHQAAEALGARTARGGGRRDRGLRGPCAVATTRRRPARWWWITMRGHRPRTIACSYCGVLTLVPLYTSTSNYLPLGVTAFLPPATEVLCVAAVEHVEASSHPARATITQLGLWFGVCRDGDESPGRRSPRLFAAHSADESALDQRLDGGLGAHYLQLWDQVPVSYDDDWCQSRVQG